MYNLEKNEIEKCVHSSSLAMSSSFLSLSRVPVLHEVRDITMARVGDVALVSYENKVRMQAV